MRHLVGLLNWPLALALMAFVLRLGPMSPAHAAIEPGPGMGWLMIASRVRADDAIALASGYANRFPGAVVFESSNGYFGVSLGWSDIDRARPLLQSLIARGEIPTDSYFTAGARFVRAVWAAGNGHTRPLPEMLSTTRLLDAAAPQPPPATAGQTGRVTGLNPNGDNFLSLRTGPGTANPEIARMLPDTPVTILGTSGSWYNVVLANGLTGWAHGRYIAVGSVPTIGPGPSPDAGGGQAGASE